MTLRFNTAERRLSLVPMFVSAVEVRRSLGCSRSLAYEHLRRAAGREPGARGLLRVPLDVWERYEVLSCSGSSGVAASGTAGSTRTAGASPAPRGAAIARPPSASPGSGSATPPIPITQPRGPRH